MSRTVAIVGGGISGLATAYFLREEARRTGIALNCTLIECEERLGGKILTENIEGFVIEGGPDSFLTLKPWALDLCQRLGLSDHLMGPNSGRPKVYVLIDGKLKELPDGFALTVPTRLKSLLRTDLLTPWGKARMLLDFLMPRKRDRRDESLARFIRRRFGREALQRLAEPLMAGIYAGEAEQLSAWATFPQLCELEVKHGSLILEMLAKKRMATFSPSQANHTPIFMTLRSGLVELVDALVSQLEDVTILTGRKVAALHPRRSHKEDSYDLRLEDGSVVRADAVVLATPAYVSAALLRDTNPEAARILRSIPYVSTATVSLAYERTSFPHRLDGYGFVVPQGEKRKITACTWVSSKWPAHSPSDHVLLRCFLGRAGDEYALHLGDEELCGLVQDELHSILGVSMEPVLKRVYRWKESMPQYLVGHLEKMAALEEALGKQTGIFLTGAAYRGVGLPDCIHQGAQTAAKVFRYLTREELLPSVAEVRESKSSPHYAGADYEDADYSTQTLSPWHSVPRRVSEHDDAVSKSREAS